MRARLLGLVMIAGCGGAPPAPAEPVPPPPEPARDPAIAEPAPRPRPRIEPPSTNPRTIILRGPLSADDVIVMERNVARAEPLAEARSDFWDPCVRDLVAGLPRAQRDELGDALTLAMTTCDRAAQRATFAPPRRRSYAAGSYLGFSGEITPNSVRLELVVVRRGGPPPERITLLAGATRWTSPTLDDTQDGDAFVATVPYTRSAARVLHVLLDAPDPILRFESADGADDIVIGDDMKSDLRVFADLVN